MNTQDQTPEPPVRRIDRWLAFTSITLIALAIICFVAVLIGTTAGADFSGPIWGAVSVVMRLGLPVGVFLFLALLIMNMMRRSRATRAAGPGRKG